MIVKGSGKLDRKCLNEKPRKFLEYEEYYKVCMDASKHANGRVGIVISDMRKGRNCLVKLLKGIQVENTEK